jgi:hypothetical protein
MRFVDAVLRSVELSLNLSAYLLEYDCDRFQQCCKDALSGGKIRSALALRRLLRRRFAGVEVVLQTFAAHQRIALLPDVYVAVEVLTAEELNQSRMEELLALAGGMLSVERLTSGELHVVQVHRKRRDGRKVGDGRLAQGAFRLERFDAELAARTEMCACGCVPVQAWPPARYAPSAIRRKLSRQPSICPLPGADVAPLLSTYKVDLCALQVVEMLYAVIRGAAALRKSSVECFQRHENISEDDIYKLLLKRRRGGESLVPSKKAASAAFAHFVFRGNGWLRVDGIKEKWMKMSRAKVTQVDSSHSEKAVGWMQRDLDRLAQHRRRCKQDVQQAFIACMAYGQTTPTTITLPLSSQDVQGLRPEPQIPQDEEEESESDDGSCSTHVSRAPYAG